METVTDFICLGSKITADGVCSHEIKRHSLLGRKAMTNLDSVLKSRDITLPTKVHLVKALVFPVVMYGYESWTIKKAKCRRINFWTVVLEKALESPLDYKEIKLVHPKGNQYWIFIERTDAESEAPILWPPDSKNWLIGKDLDAGKDWRQEEKGMREDEMVGWHHWLDGHEFEQALGVGDGQGSLACCNPWVRKEWDTNEQLNWTSKPSTPRGQEVRLLLMVCLHPGDSSDLLTFSPRGCSGWVPPSPTPIQMSCACMGLPGCLWRCILL